MEELRARAHSARRSHEQLQSLLDAVTAISGDLELPVVLGRIVRAACSLVNARYGALGVLDPGGEHLVEFVTHGVSPEERERIGDLPRGHGVLGLLITDPHPLRLSDISAHPGSYGFPPNHPPMRSFLGTPIRIRDVVFGNLYLAERLGGKEFSETDEAMLVALASAAGVAIENARLYQRAQQQRQWAQAAGELAQNLLESETEDAALTMMVEQVCELTGAELSFVAVREEGAPESVRALHVRDPAPTRTQRPLSEWPALTEAHWSHLLGSGAHLLITPDSASDEAKQVTSELSRLTGCGSGGPTAIVTISAGTGDIGHLLLHWREGQQDAASQAMSGLEGYAQQAGLGLIAARAKRDRALLAMLEDRDRIARDMHDHVIQRLFATGLSLQAAARLAVHPVVRSRLDEAVDSLDTAIRDIRSTIFELHTQAATEELGLQLHHLVDSYADHLGFVPTLEVRGDPGRADDALGTDLLAVVREGLSNVARHAHASEASVLVMIGESATVAVTDNGRGLGTEQRRSGLSNLEKRAAARSGSFELGAGDAGGTRLTWSAPLSR